MNLEKVYYDLDGNKVNILQLIKLCPEWAASRIQQMEKQLENYVPCDHKKYHCKATDDGTRSGKEG